MNYKIISYIQLLFFILFITINCILFSFSIPLLLIVAMNIPIVGTHILLQYIFFKKVKDVVVQTKDDKEAEFQKSLKNIYDEHIFSITHELRSPLAVITASCVNLYNSLKHIYNLLPPEEREKFCQNFKDSKINIEYVRHQSEVIESFIASISEHASYISNDGDKKYIDLHKYLISIIMNCRSFSRNMKIFQNNIRFGDFTGSDFINISVQVSPHDLSRMLTNIMTNAADAADESYKNKKEENPDYSPYLKIRCLKAFDSKTDIVLTDDFVPLNAESNEFQQGHPFYLIIEDNGNGFSQDDITKIIKCRHSTKTNKSNEHTHHGLGLHLTKKLATKNGIKLYINTSKSGTLFALGFSTIYVGKYETLKDDESSAKLLKNQFVSDDAIELYANYKKKEGASGTKYSMVKIKNAPKKSLWSIFTNKNKDKS